LRFFLSISWPQLPQKLASGWSFLPHLAQNMNTLSLPAYAMSAVRSNGGVLMNYLRRRQRQSQYVIKLAPTNAILRAPPTLFGLSKPPKRGSKVNQNSTLLLIVHTTGSRSNIRQRAPSDLSIPISISSAGGVARDRVDAALPQLPQKSSSGWSFSPHFLQNIVALPLSVYASSGYNRGTLYQQKRRAVQVFDHPHDPNPNAEWTAKG